MPLNLSQAVKGTIVDRICEWGEDGKERPLNPIRRGIIVRVDGDPRQESVQAIYVCFSPDKGEDTVKINGTEVRCEKTKASELIEVYDFEHSISRKAWRRLFNYAEQVGYESMQRKPKASRFRKVQDALGLTKTNRDGAVVHDDPANMSMDEDVYMDDSPKEKPKNDLVR